MSERGTPATTTVVILKRDFAEAVENWHRRTPISGEFGARHSAASWFGDLGGAVFREGVEERAVRGGGGVFSGLDMFMLGLFLGGYG